MTKTVQIRVRSLRAGEIDEFVTRSLHAYWEDPWDRKDLEKFCNCPDCWIKVIQRDGQIVAGMGYILHKRVVTIRHLFVTKLARRRGLGKRLIRHILMSLKRMQRRIVAVEVPEKQLAAQLFFKACGFYWFRTVQKNGRTLYCMRYIAPQR